ncbi:hypothetical protein BDF22DRAFT_745756 [Syncephalis plumigaleata]|nr:hypothetical protein BDF22DRAFT_745756 [Syncephalis plumigaleata]
MATAKQKGKGIWQDIAHYSDEEEESSVFLTGFLKFIDVQPQSKPVSFECGICYSKFVTATTNAGSSRGPVHGQFLSCKHGYCDTFPECQYEITEKHVQSLLTAKDYDLWKRKKEESNMNGKMYCPNKRCSKVLTISQLSRANDCLAECTHCHYAICTKCTCLWHNGYSCAQYKAIPDARKNTEDSSVLAMAKDNKWCRCTKCQALVELRYGCNHITCHCGHQFCYKCGSSWNETTRLCSTGKCDLWDEDMLILAQNDREAQPVQPVQPVQVQPAQWRPVPPVQVQPQNQRPGAPTMAL